jgi:hypothetical protein
VDNISFTDRLRYQRLVLLAEAENYRKQAYKPATPVAVRSLLLDLARKSDDLATATKWLYDAIGTATSPSARKDCDSVARHAFRQAAADVLKNHESDDKCLAWAMAAMEEYGDA